MKIGDIIIDPPVLMAPMAGVTDYPYRQILREMECELLFTEMVSAKGLTYGNKRTEELIDFSDEGYTGVQLFGVEPDTMAEAASIVERKYQPDVIDINMGCPAPKITKNGSGSALMKDPEIAGKVTKAVVEAVQIPVTVKMRKGWDNERINAVQISKLAEENGAKAVTVHGRTREDYYSGEADWDIFKQVKETVDIPFIGNGDIFGPRDAAEMIENTGCDGVMIARGAQGNPWLLKRTIKYLESGELSSEPDSDQIINMALKHLRLAIDYYGEKVAVPRMRKHLAWYIKGLPYASNIREKVNKLNTYSEIENLCNKYQSQLEEYRNS